MDDFLDKPGLAAKAECRVPERRQVFQAIQPGFFFDFAQSGLDQGLAAFLVAFGKSPTPERILDEKYLDAVSATPKDDAARRNLVADAARYLVIRRRLAAFWLTRPAPEPVFR